MVVFGTLSAVFDLLLIAVLLHWRTPLPLFRTAWFIESACSEVLVTFAIRTRSAVWRSRPSRWLLWSSVATAAVAFALPFMDVGRRYFEFAAPSRRVSALVVAVLLAYVVAAEVAKRPIFRRLAL